MSFLPIRVIDDFATGDHGLSRRNNFTPAMYGSPGAPPVSPSRKFRSMARRSTLALADETVDYSADRFRT